MDHKAKLTDLIPKGDGYNSDYANTLADAAEHMERRRVFDGLDGCRRLQDGR